MAGSRPEEIEATQAEVARLNAEKDHLEEKVRLARVLSPITGVVTTPKLKEKLGQHVKEGDLIAEVYDLTTVTAEISIPEKEIGDVTVGQDVLLKVRAYPEKNFYGKVTSIAPAVTEQENPLMQKTIRVSTRIKNPALLLKPDMTGNAKIYVGERRLIDIMTRRFTRYLRVEFWSWW
ncbi:MAG: HlyD family efflux transporter periplasmic adaptor subunit [Deltaproteobacteria bacterium]|nr:HlyD family efflux transporter periplasmic adaptor subunit [Deltaproteobacteria bacterium]